MKRADEKNKILISGSVKKISFIGGRVVLSINGESVIFSEKNSDLISQRKIILNDKVIVIGALINSDVLGWDIRKIGYVKTANYIMILGKIEKLSDNTVTVKAKKNFSLSLGAVISPPEMKIGEVHAFLCSLEYISECVFPTCIKRSPVACASCTETTKSISGMLIERIE